MLQIRDDTTIETNEQVTVTDNQQTFSDPQSQHHEQVNLPSEEATESQILHKPDDVASEANEHATGTGNHQTLPEPHSQHEQMRLSEEKSFSQTIQESNVENIDSATVVANEQASDTGNQQTFSEPQSQHHHEQFKPDLPCNVPSEEVIESQILHKPDDAAAEANEHTTGTGNHQTFSDHQSQHEQMKLSEQTALSHTNQESEIENVENIDKTTVEETVDANEHMNDTGNHKADLQSSNTLDEVKQTSEASQTPQETKPIDQEDHSFVQSDKLGGTQPSTYVEPQNDHQPVMEPVEEKPKTNGVHKPTVSEITEQPSSVSNSCLSIEPQVDANVFTNETNNVCATVNEVGNANLPEVVNKITESNGNSEPSLVVNGHEDCKDVNLEQFARIDPHEGEERVVQAVNEEPLVNGNYDPELEPNCIKNGTNDKDNNSANHDAKERLIGI